MTQIGDSGCRGRGGPLRTAFQLTALPLAASIAAMLISAPTASAASLVNSYDVCSALRTGTSLAAVESSLVARGYSSFNAGTLTGTAIKNRCPDQAARVVARLKKLGA